MAKVWKVLLAVLYYAVLTAVLFAHFLSPVFLILTKPIFCEYLQCARDSAIVTDLSGLAV